MLRAPHRLSRLAAACAACAVACVVGPAGARPPDTAFIEDIHLHPAGPAELQLSYEIDSPGIDGVDSVELVAVRAASGFDRAPMDFQLTAGLGQVDGGDARLDHFGIRARYRLAGTPGEPGVAAFGGYRRLLAADAHFIEEGVAVRWNRRFLSASGEVSGRQVFGAIDDPQVEVRVGASITYDLGLDLIRVGAEVLALLPLTGRRVSDLGLGGDADAVAIYVGPSLRLDFEYMWLSAGVATGEITDGGAQILVRTTAAVQF